MAVFVVSLDTCVLYPSMLRDVLLRGAEKGVYQIRWSNETIVELRRNLVADLGADCVVSIDRTIAAMAKYFPDAMTFPTQDLINAMTNHPKDRHVLAGAVTGHASVIVTDNTKDFPASSVEPYEIDIQTADEFLTTQLGMSPKTFAGIARDIINDYKNPPYSRDEFLARLQKSVPKFAAGLSSLI